MYYLRCMHDGSIDYSCTPSVAIYGTFWECAGQRNFTYQSLNAGKYIYVGGDVVIARGIVNRFIAEFVHHDFSIHALVNTLNQEALNTGQDQSSKIDPHCLSHILYCYLYVLMNVSFGNAVVKTPIRIDDYDMWAFEQFPRLLSSFTYLWMNHQSLIGSCHKQCSRSLVVDGNQKIRRRICAFKEIRVDTNEMHQVLVGCCRTPVTGSRYCGVHANNVAERAETDEAEGNVGQPTRKQPKTRSAWKASRSENNLNATNCRTRKDRPDDYVNKCIRSFGFIALVFNCRVITAFSELFRSETLREIINLFVASIEGKVHYSVSNV